MNVCVIVRYGQGDIWYTVLSKETYDALPDNHDLGSFEDDEEIETLFSLIDLFKYAEKNSYTIVEDHVGYIY